MPSLVKVEGQKEACQKLSVTVSLVVPFHFGWQEIGKSDNTWVIIFYMRFVARNQRPRWVFMSWKVQGSKGEKDIIKVLEPLSLMSRWRNTSREAERADLSLVGCGISLQYVLLDANSVGGLRKVQLCHQLKVSQLSRSLQLSSQMGSGWWVGEKGRARSMLDTPMQELMESTVSQDWPQIVKCFLQAVARRERYQRSF